MVSQFQSRVPFHSHSLHVSLNRAGAPPTSISESRWKPFEDFQEDSYETNVRLHPQSPDDPIIRSEEETHENVSILSLDARATNRFPFVQNDLCFFVRAQTFCRNEEVSVGSGEARIEIRCLRRMKRNEWTSESYGQCRPLRGTTTKRADLGVRWHHHWLANRRLPSQGIMGYARRRQRANAWCNITS